MLRAVGLVMLQTFTLLRRDRIFWPAMAAAVAIAIFAGLASHWGVEDIEKILYDLGFFGFQLTGSALAIFFGVKMIGDARQDGSLEVQLAAPVSRSVWLCGKYLGLCVCLLFVAAAFLLIWQGTLLALGFAGMRAPQLAVFGLMVLGWLVIGALAVFFATLSRASLALFSALAVWGAGLASALVDQSMTDDTPAPLRMMAGLVARYWDLQQFNLIDHAIDDALAKLPGLATRGAYGLILIAILITVSGLVWSRRDALPA